MSVSVLGAGAWGTALASMLAHGNTRVVLWGRDQHVVDEINQSQRNSAYLGDIPLPNNVQATTDIKAACSANTVLYVLPAQSFRSVAPIIKSRLNPNTQLILCAKGIDQESGKLLHEMAAESFGSNPIFALSGPSFASDVARGLPTAVSLAADSLDDAKILAEELSRPRFRIYASDDLTGVEAGGALKNVLALAVGITRGLELGASAEAALIARGFAELQRLALALGGRSETLSGLSGLGDLVLTCSSPQSRNFSFGEALARGEDLLDRPLAEGVHSAAMAVKLATYHSIDVPLMGMVQRVLNGEVQPKEAVSLLLARPLKGEA